jgi:hypothetical protein
MNLALELAADEQAHVILLSNALGNDASARSDLHIEPSRDQFHAGW